jgi:hypothetical protein
VEDRRKVGQLSISDAQGNVVASWEIESITEDDNGESMTFLDYPNYQEIQNAIDSLDPTNIKKRYVWENHPWVTTQRRIVK